MKADNQFRNKLLVEYLFQLVKGNHKDTFDKFFGEVESYLGQRVHESSSKEEVLKIQAILNYRKLDRVMEM